MAIILERSLTWIGERIWFWQLNYSNRVNWMWAQEQFISSKVSQLEREFNEVPADDGTKRRAIEKKIYAFKRIGEETPEFLRLLDEAKDVVGDERVTKISSIVYKKFLRSDFKG